MGEGKEGREGKVEREGLVFQYRRMEIRGTAFNAAIK